MKRLVNTFVLLAFLSLGFSSLHANSLITADDLKAILNDENVQIVSCQKEADFKTSHIKGALQIWHTEMYIKPSEMGILMNSEELTNYFGLKGIDFSKQIILYDDGSNKYACRVFWALQYLGLTQIKILSGHFDEWYAKGYPVTKNPTPFKKVKNNLQLNESVFSSIKDVEASTSNPDILLIDVRSKEEFNNLGHIPGATLFYWESVLNLNKSFKSRELITEIAKADGLEPDKEIILYCATAVKASVIYFALKEIAHYPNVKIYEGAFKEWTSKNSSIIIN
ncbi:MAG: sulfurtransferase [Bacteroidetes bacterium]|jgi:thiosulfate/3-mercaptopyruvate sulfurtransferase|nr:sulfurtransferase [Bacteroidota bacterium]MBT4336978.1 sulfurtransferase [Bacteroidota bacterium]MBT6835107.1 sulfurtransferase [Bacteroidota bacterium]MBT7040141.1 sulfurtransferase [Bacteroidota bacterium]MBT7826828.1 sulfurtransferase [Bacteroidota bacterium]